MKIAESFPKTFNISLQTVEPSEKKPSTCPKTIRVISSVRPAKKEENTANTMFKFGHENLGPQGLSLHTPDPYKGFLWPQPQTPSDLMTPTFGLFDTNDNPFDLTLGPGEDGLLKLDPILTPGPNLDKTDMELLSPLDQLDPQEVEDLLHEINATDCVEPGTQGLLDQQEPCLTDTPTETEVTRNLRSLSHDHDYLGVDEKIFNEFFYPDQPPMEEALAPEPNFMDTLFDLEPFLAQVEKEEPFPDPEPAGELDQKAAHPDQELALVGQDPAVVMTTGELVMKPGVTDIKDGLAKTSKTYRPIAKDGKYRERRDKNNAASRVSRRTRKEKRVAMIAEKERLEERNAQLKVEIENLEKLAATWKDKLLNILSK